MALRDYQQLALEHISHRIEEGDTRIYTTLPTGTGKGVILAALAAHELQAGRVLVLIHRQDIALQLVRTLRQAGLEVGLVMQGSRQLTAPVSVATVQSLPTAILEDLIAAKDDPIATILIDEAHHAVQGSVYERIITRLEEVDDELQVVTVGFTATPYRSDKKSMLEVLPVCAFARDIPDMVRARWLAPLIWEPLRMELDLEEVATTRRFGEVDYVEEELELELLRATVTEAIVERVAKRIEQRPTLVFGVTVAHARQLAETFCQYGLKAATVSSETSRADRERLFAAWRAGDLQVICNCALLTEGFDFPEIAALVMARPTLSPGFYMQMLGRGTRPAPGKTNCLVLDVMGNNPDTSTQVVLPHVVGISKAGNGRPGERVTASDPILQALLGAGTETGLSLLDPIGRSQYRWAAYRHGYFAMVGQEEAAIIERDPQGSGLYRSRLYIMQRGQPPVHEWIRQEYLPLRQQVALVHEYTGAIYVEMLGSKEARWLDQPASEKQIAALHKLNPTLAQQATAKKWTKRTASDAISFCLLRRTLEHPPELAYPFSRGIFSKCKEDIAQ